MSGKKILVSLQNNLVHIQIKEDYILKWSLLFLYAKIDFQVITVLVTTA